MLPPGKDARKRVKMIVDLFRQFMLNDLVVDSNSPATKEVFRLAAFKGKRTKCPFSLEE